MMKKDIYQELYDELIASNDVLGVLLVGKAATTKLEDFDSLNDIDLIVLTALGEKNKRVAKKVAGVDIDMSYLPVSFVKDCIKDNVLLWIEILASGKIVYSRGIDDLVERCKLIWATGTPELTKIQKEYWSFYLTSSLEDIKNRLHNEALAKYLIGEFLSSVMRVEYKLNKNFIPLKKKRWIEQIKGMNVEIGELIDQILLSPTLKEQFELTESLYRLIIMPLGGPVDTWSHEEFPEE